MGWRAACLVWAAAHVLVCLPLNALLPRGIHRTVSTTAADAGPHTPQRKWMVAALALVFAGTWFGSTAMAAHLPRVLQEAGASPAAIAAAALVGPAQVAAGVLEFWLMRHLQPLTSAQFAALAHPVGAGVLLVAGAPAAPVLTVAHGGGNGILTIANGTLPLHLFGPAGYGLRQGLLMMPARFLQAGAPFLFDLALTRHGTEALGFTAALGVLSFAMLSTLSVATRSKAS